MEFNGIEDLILIKSIVNVGVNWCRKNRKEFSINITFTAESCRVSMGFSSNHISEEETEELLNLLHQSEELMHLKRVFDDLNELTLSVDKNEVNTVLKIQSVVEDKFKKLGHELFPETFNY